MFPSPSLGPPLLSASASPAFGPCGMPAELVLVALDDELDEVVAGAVLEALDGVVAGAALEVLDEELGGPPPQPATTSATTTMAAPSRRRLVSNPGMVISKPPLCACVCAMSMSTTPDARHRGLLPRASDRRNRPTREGTAIPGVLLN
jgi:hypothetical protein